MMSNVSHRRRPSDVAAGILKTLFSRFRRHDDTKRSLSTGDLVTPPTNSEDNYMVMDFTQAPTTSTIAPHFDDCDRVPMLFCDHSPAKLLPQSRAAARDLLRNGSAEDLRKVPVAELHQSQSWFYPNVDSAKAERLLMDAGYEEGSFLVYCVGQLYQLCFVHNGKISHIRIAVRTKDSRPKYSIDLDRTFKNLCDLIDYYHSHKGYVLPRKLKNGVARPLRIPHVSHRTRA